MAENEYIKLSTEPGPIGIFDSGYGGLTILKEIRQLMPKYDYLYLGDNARTPYGTRSFQVVYEFTLQSVQKLFSIGCHLVILACNTASAKALRTIQQRDLPRLDQHRRVLGIIRPTAEIIGQLTETRHIGILATPGTIKSLSYPLEIKKLYPDITVQGEACPIWVPLVETGEFKTPGAGVFIKKHVENLLAKDDMIDTIVLGCTHYPLLSALIKQYVPSHIKIIEQGPYVAQSLKDYLERHDIERLCTCGGTCRYLTTESAETFQISAKHFVKEDIKVSTITL